MTRPVRDAWLYGSAILSVLHALAWLIAPFWLASLLRPWQLTETQRAIGALIWAIDRLFAAIVMFALGRLLRERFRFQRVQPYIKALVFTYVLGCFFDVFGFFVKLNLVLAVAVYTLPTSLFLAALGLGLLHLPDTGRSVVRPFAYLQIGTAILMATYYYAYLALPCGALGAIVLAFLFLEQANRPTLDLPARGLAVTS